jgi:hypothetical protein
MKHSLTHYITTIILSTFLLFSGHAHSSVLALCVGVDGHVELEFAIGGDCATDVDDHAESVEELHSQPEADLDHCGSCVDIPINLGHADTCEPVVTVSKRSLDMPVSNTILVTLDTVDTHYVSHRMILSPDILPVALACKRTVSLLI